MRLGSVLTGATRAVARARGVAGARAVARVSDGRVIALMVALTVLAVIGWQPAKAGPIGPQLPKAIKGEKCVTPIPDIRRNHMAYLDHHRDRTVHEGVRTKKFSLKGCIECHAVKSEDDTFLTVKDPRHFCRVCHDYAAVKMDCFDCHASRPEANKNKAQIMPKDRAANQSELAAMHNYVAEKNYVKGARR